MKKRGKSSETVLRDGDKSTLSSSPCSERHKVDSMSPCSETVSRRKPGRQEDSTRRPTLFVSLPSTSRLRSPITDMRQKNGTGSRSSPSSSRDAGRKTVEVRRYRSALLEGSCTLESVASRK